LLVASSTTLTLTGTLTARGGPGGATSPSGATFAAGGGSGGGIRLVATTLAGTGRTINAGGGPPGTGVGGGTGGVGRIRLEAFSNALTVNLSGVSPSVGVPGAVFPTGLPTLAIASVGGLAAPAAPAGSYSAPDVRLPSTATSPVAVVVTATNVPDGTPIVMRATPQTGAVTTATTPGLSGGTASATLAMDLTQPNVIAAGATFQIAAADVPVHVAQLAGPEDRITSVRVEAAFGRSSQVTYITRAGRELHP
jgi:hypothetical protein